MRITTLEYTRRYNLGPYEHEEIKIGAASDEGDNAVQSIATLKLTVAQGRCPETVVVPFDAKLHGARVSVPFNAEAAVVAAAAAAKVEKAAAKKAPAKAAPTDVATTSPTADEKGPWKSPTDRDENATEAVEEATADALAADPAPEKAEPKAKATKVRKVGTPYDRNNEIHRKLMSELLDKEFKGWRSDAAKAVKASHELVGLEFLDIEGMPTAGFIAALKEKMK